MKKLIVVAIALVLLLSFSGCCMSIEENLTSYTATFTMYIQNEFSPSDLSGTSCFPMTSQTLTNTYMQIIKSNRVLDTVVEELGTNLTANQIREMLSIEAVEDTSVLGISVTSNDSQLSLDIAQAIAEVAPEEISEILEGSYVRIIDSPKVTEETSLRNLFR